MNGFRTRSRSEMIPKTTSPAASNAQNQSPTLLAVDSEKPCRVKYTVKR